MAVDRRLSPAYAGKYPKKLRGKQAKAIADAAVNTVRKNTKDTFSCEPLCGAATGAGAATGTAGDTNLLRTDAALYEYDIKGTQTIVAPSHSSSGLDISLDQTDNDGVEITQGVTSRSRSAFTVGTDGPFYFEVELSVADVSGTDDCAIGFRKAEAYQANIDDYDEMACLNVISGDIKIETILNNAATTTTDTTSNLADGGSVTLRVEVDREGRVTYKIDGDTPSTTAAFTFDDGEVVVPFLFFLHAADVAGAVNLKQWNCGLV